LYSVLFFSYVFSDREASCFLLIKIGISSRSLRAAEVKLFNNPDLINEMAAASLDPVFQDHTVLSRIRCDIMEQALYSSGNAG